MHRSILRLCHANLTHNISLFFQKHFSSSFHSESSTGTYNWSLYTCFCWSRSLSVGIAPAFNLILLLLPKLRARMTSFKAVGGEMFNANYRAICSVPVNSNVYSRSLYTQKLREEFSSQIFIGIPSKLCASFRE